MNNYLPNIVVAMSNLYFLYLARNDNIHYILFFPMMASFIYHLAETKHGLQGLPIINKYSDELLFVDRIGAFFAAIYILQQIELYTIFLLIIGLIFLIHSEMDNIISYTKCKITKYNIYQINPHLTPIEYIVSHCLWHVFAFEALYYSIKLKN